MAVSKKTRQILDETSGEFSLALSRLGDGGRMTDLERARAWTGFDATGKLSQHRFLLESGRQEQLDAYEEQLREIRKEWEAMLDAARREGAVAALRAALPAEPTPEMMSAIREAYWNQAKVDYLHSVYHALRAHLLGEDA